MDTATITSVEDAIQRLTEWQVENGVIPTQPAFGDTLTTDTGWAFFNVNGYLGTVTSDGQVIFEDVYDDYE